MKIGTINVISEGMIGTAFLGLIGFAIWHVAYIGVIFFAIFVTIYSLSSIIKTHPNRVFFQKLSELRLSKKHNPELINLILAGNAENITNQKFAIIEACREIERRMKLSVNALLFVILGFLLICNGGFYLPFPNYVYPSIQGILGAILGVIYGFVVRGRVHRIKKGLNIM